jgi:hypothetical protein
MLIYRANTPIVAMDSRTQPGTRFVTIPAGSLITVEKDVNLFGLLEITWGCEKLEVFTRDLQERAEELTRKPIARTGRPLTAAQPAAS